MKLIFRVSAPTFARLPSPGRVAPSRSMDGAGWQHSSFGNPERLRDLAVICLGISLFCVVVLLLRQLLPPSPKLSGSRGGRAPLLPFDDGIGCANGSGTMGSVLPHAVLDAAAAGDALSLREWVLDPRCCIDACSPLR